MRSTLSRPAPIGAGLRDPAAGLPALRGLQPTASSPSIAPRSERPLRRGSAAG
ncbi:hypothetical protein ACFPRL_15005 [Pseudoclavibacter helvolus]